MRLIDADALNARIDKCVGVDGLGLEPVMAIRDIKSLLSVMPTIAAIPVEWINTLMLDGEPEESKSAWRVLKAWKREQEAHDDAGKPV